MKDQKEMAVYGMGMHCPKLVLGVFALVVLLLAFSIFQQAMYSPTIEIQSSTLLKNTVSVSGTKQLEKAPDQAVAYISVTTDDADPSTAQTQNAAKSNAVISAVKSWGAAPADIETTAYTLQKKQVWNYTAQTYEDRGYTASQSLKVTTSRIADLGGLVDAAVGAGSNGIDQITFTLTKDSETAARTEALQQAMQVAQQKAQALSTTAGIAIGNVVTIEEQNFVFQPYVYSKDMAAAAPLGAGTQITPSKVEIDATVNVVYSIK